MSKDKSSIPPTPSFQADPNLGWSQDVLKGQSDYLLKGLTNEGSSLSGLLNETVQLSPEISQLAMTRMRAALEPQMRESRQNVTNQLEANNQLTGSTTASALGNLEADYLSALTAAGAEASIADINRALSNRVSLYGLGLNTAQGVGGNALQNQQQMNQFALQNYENQVAASLMGQDASSGGLMGGLTGAVGGGITGFMLGGPWGAAAGAVAGGGLGYLGSPGTGGGMLSSGALAAGLGSNRFIGSGGTSTRESIYNPQYESVYNPGFGATGSQLARTYYGF